jgi:hypothetical protein
MSLASWLTGGGEKKTWFYSTHDYEPFGQTWVTQGEVFFHDWSYGNG